MPLSRPTLTPAEVSTRAVLEPLFDSDFGEELSVGKMPPSHTKAGQGRAGFRRFWRWLFLRDRKKPAQEAPWENETVRRVTEEMAPVLSGSNLPVRTVEGFEIPIWEYDAGLWENQSLGTVVSSFREAYGLSSDALAGEINVRPGILQDLERGRYGHLPPHTIVRGHIRALAERLHLPADMLLAKYEAECPFDQAPNRRVPLPSQHLRRPLPTRMLLGLVAATLVILYLAWASFFGGEGGFATSSFWERVSGSFGGGTEPEIVSAQPVFTDRGEEISEEEIQRFFNLTRNAPLADDEALYATDELSPENRIAEIDGWQVPHAADRPPLPLGFAPVPNAKPPIQLLVQTGDTQGIGRLPLETQEGQQLIRSHAVSLVDEPLENRLLILAKRTTWLQVRDSNGGLIQSKLLEMGESFLITPESGQVLHLEDIRAVAASYNGERLALPSSGNRFSLDPSRF